MGKSKLEAKSDQKPKRLKTTSRQTKKWMGGKEGWEGLSKTHSDLSRGNSERNLRKSSNVKLRAVTDRDMDKSELPDGSNTRIGRIGRKLQYSPIEHHSIRTHREPLEKAMNETTSTEGLVHTYFNTNEGYQENKGNSWGKLEIISGLLEEKEEQVSKYLSCIIQLKDNMAYLNIVMKNIVDSLYTLRMQVRTKSEDYIKELLGRRDNIRENINIPHNIRIQPNQEGAQGGFYTEASGSGSQQHNILLCRNIEEDKTSYELHIGNIMEVLYDAVSRNNEAIEHFSELRGNIGRGGLGSGKKNRLGLFLDIMGLELQANREKELLGEGKYKYKYIPGNPDPGAQYLQGYSDAQDSPSQHIQLPFHTHTEEDMMIIQDPDPPLDTSNTQGAGDGDDKQLIHVLQTKANQNKLKINMLESNLREVKDSFELKHKENLKLLEEKRGHLAYIEELKSKFKTLK